MIKLELKSIIEWPFTLQLLVVLPFCMATLYMIYLFDLTSLNKTLLNAKRQEADLQQQIELIFKQQIKLENELTQLPLLERIFSEWQAKLVVPAEIPDLLDRILKIGTANGVSFDQLHPGLEAKDGIYVKVPIKITGQGGYHQIATFISQIANLSSLVVVRSLSLSRVASQDTGETNIIEHMTAKNKLSVEMILEVYSLSMPGSSSHEPK